jgi:uncharacterized membrane protein YqaE (UPF0057 family)
MKKLLMYAMMLVMSMGLTKQSFAIGLAGTANQTIAVTATESKKEVSVKGGGAEIDKTVYILLAILGLGWVGIGLNDDWKGSKWLISLLLYCLLWLPGFIYTLMQMKNYY